MAVKDESLHRETEDFILPKPRKYYRAAIQTDHWQLRSLISSPQEDIIYYPSGSDIIRLDTKRQERETITTLSFAPKCLAASKDWLCCGGNNGKYVAVCLDESRKGLIEGETDPDARLPLDLDPSSRTTARESLSASSSYSTLRRTRGPLAVKSSKIGQEIVNCIELWSPTAYASEAAYDIPVAVVANNDRSVFIIDVAESRVLEHIEYPDNVNRAVISPDGTLLISICDDPYLYLYQRVPKKLGGKGLLSVEDRYQWRDCGRLGLIGQKQSDTSTMRGSFAACFSNSGKYLAVATQYGVISIFDAETLTDDNVDSLLKVFTTSRPGREIGAVRAMSFSPGPFDLLAWTESSGRVGVADLRNMFISRQVVNIDSHADGVERAIVISRPSDAAIDPRLRSFRAESPSGSSTTPDYLGLDLERRQLRHLTREMLDRHQPPLTAEELEVLHAHRIARRQRDEANEAREVSERASSSSRLSLLRDIQTLTNSSGSRSSERRISTTNLPAALREFVNPERSGASFRSFLNERNQDRERRSQLEQEPRRLNLIQLAAAESALDRELSGPGTQRGTPDPASALERLSLTPARQTPSGSDSPNNPWAEIDNLYRTRYPSDPPLDRSSRLRIEIEDEDRRDFAHRLRQPWRPAGDLELPNPEIRGVHAGSAIRSMLRTNSFETMGCSWSPDGRVLYIASEEGIHEYHVNVASRKMFPALVLR